MPSETLFFKFEADFVESLRCIPMQVRLKLDTCGVKLKLSHWHQLTQAERRSLTQLPCSTPAEIDHYRQQLQQRVTHHSGAPAEELPIDPQPAWLEGEIPAQVEARAASADAEISAQQWQLLSPTQRFALLKLSRPSHESQNFVPALREFGLLP
ncbi:MAG: nitrate reductase maturation protein NarM [Leptolyngbyaceae cyanobacterium RM1_1_2]|nr:nitrate reductase maturation protein NarM [Leptolyngbyaceae cyanobacterium RM1_1_2]